MGRERLSNTLIFAWLAWVFPLAGAVLTPVFAMMGKRVRDYMAVVFSFLAVVCTVSLAGYFLDKNVVWPLQSQVSWVNVQGSPILSHIEAGMLVDPLSIIMANVVSIIAFLIMVYSIGYMKGEEGLTRYWFFMNLFIGNMLLLVLSDNLIQMLFGWEGVGLCSYALIGFYYKDRKSDWSTYWVGEGDEAYSPSHAGMKAFIATRIGDLLLFVGAFIIVAFTGTLNFVELQNGAISRVPLWALVPAALFLLGGPIGKSAQLPLMEWLPDAMAGPATVSALIHAATMVKAGVYLAARMFPIFYLFAWSTGTNTLTTFFYFMAWIGVVTAVVSGTQAAVSSEIKKVLAYSTVSQIGFMMLSLGLAGLSVEFITGYVASVFQLVSHAMFKAALFLAAGSVIHLAGSRFMRDMGGLKKYMPITFWSMALASCSLAGVPILFSGFWSKDMILEASLISGQYLLFILGLFLVVLTSFYTFRMVGMVFYGESKVKQEDASAHGNNLGEAPPTMWVPYVVLVAGTIFLGVVGFFARNWLISTFGYLVSLLGGGVAENTSTEVFIGILSTVSVAVGFLPAYLFYIKRSRNADTYVEKHGLVSSFRSFFFNRWYINRIYYHAIVYPTLSLSNWLFSNVEVNVIDGLNYYIAGAVKRVSSYVRRWQTGNMNDDLILVLVGIFVVVLILRFLVLGS
jgi:NADH-quinone oxidoreductase subunit L